MESFPPLPKLSSWMVLAVVPMSAACPFAALITPWFSTFLAISAADSALMTALLMTLAVESPWKRRFPPQKSSSLMS